MSMSSNHLPAQNYHIPKITLVRPIGIVIFRSSYAAAASVIRASCIGPYHLACAPRTWPEWLRSSAAPAPRGLQQSKDPFAVSYNYTKFEYVVCRDVFQRVEKVWRAKTGIFCIVCREQGFSSQQCMQFPENQPPLTANLTDQHTVVTVKGCHCVSASLP